jgi:hypothetical protein
MLGSWRAETTLPAANSAPSLTSSDIYRAQLLDDLPRGATSANEHAAILI